MAELDNVICNECDWWGSSSELLVAKNPFDEDEKIQGCPNCKTIGDFPTLCEEAECLNEATVWGRPKPGRAYRFMCREHALK